MKYIDELNLGGKRVFIRADLNVPLAKDGSIASDNRIRASLPTVEHALSQGASVVLCSHLGRPKGTRNDSMSLKPVALRLAELLDSSVTMAENCVGDDVTAQAEALKPGEVLLLENIRFEAGEEKNDPALGEALAKLADVYVNDAFATSHRAHASTAAIVEHVAEKAGGFTMKSELEYFKKAFENPTRPLVAVFGGAKVSTKMKAIKNVAKSADAIIVGGAMANTFFAAHGHEVGKSLFEEEQKAEALAAEAELSGDSNCKLLLPLDVIVADELSSGQETQTVAVDAIPADKMALDIGPASLEAFHAALQGAGTIVWNGPMGAFETPEFSSGTYGIVDALVESSALTVVGGGDTDLALKQRDALDKMSYVSTAGGAFLQLLEGEPLPAVEALES